MGWGGVEAGFIFAWPTCCPSAKRTAKQPGDKVTGLLESDVMDQVTPALLASFTSLSFSFLVYEIVVTVPISRLDVRIKCHDPCH